MIGRIDLVELGIGLIVLGIGLIELGISLIELRIGLIKLGISQIELGIGLMELGIGLRINDARPTELARVSGQRLDTPVTPGVAIITGFPPIISYLPIYSTIR